MPYKKRKVSRKNCYKVFNSKTKKIFSKCSSFEKANKQLRMLRALKYNKNFVVRPRPKRQPQTKKTNKFVVLSIHSTNE